MVNKIILSLIIILGVVIIGLTISSWDKQITGNVTNIESSKLTPIKVGVSLPLTGEAATLGEGCLTGIELAQKEINSKDGINGRKIELAIEDDLCSLKGGANALTKLATADQVVAILGPFCSVAASAGLPVAQENKIPTMTWGATPHLTDGKDYVFRNYPSDLFQGKYAAEFMFKEGKRKVAVVYIQNDWGGGLTEVFTKRFTELGGEIVLEEGLAQDTNDLRGIITKLSAKNPDAIFFPVYPNIAVTGFKQMKEMGLTIPIYSGEVMETPQVIQSGYADGVKYTSGKVPNPEEFAEKVKRETGKNSEFATPLCYDSFYIFAEVIKDVGTNPDAIKKALQTYKKTDGVSFPVIEFDENRELKNAEFDIKIIENNQAKFLNE